MSWQLQFKMCLQSAQKSAFWTRSSLWITAALNSLVKTTTAWKKRHDRWRSNTRIIPTICLMQGNSGKPKRHGYMHTQTDRQSHRHLQTRPLIERWARVSLFPKILSNEGQNKKTHRDSRNLNIESRFRPITVFTWTGHEVEVQTQRERTNRRLGGAFPECKAMFPKSFAPICCLEDPVGWDFFLFCAWHTASTETEFVCVCVALWGVDR